MARLVGPVRAPFAWDLLFDTREAGFVSCRLRSGRWVAYMWMPSRSGPMSGRMVRSKTSTSRTLRFSVRTAAIRLGATATTCGQAVASCSSGPISSRESFGRYVNWERKVVMARKRRSKRKPPRDQRRDYTAATR